MHQRRVEHLKRPLVCSWDDGLVRLLCMLLRTTRTLTDYCEPWIRTLNDYYGEARGIGVSYKSGYGVSSEFGAFDLAGYEKGAAWWYRAWWLDAIPVNQTDRSIPTPTVPVCRIWGDRWDAGLLPLPKPPKPSPSPPTPSPPHPVPPGQGPKPGDVVARACNSSSPAQQWALAGTWRDGVARIQWKGAAVFSTAFRDSSRCLSYSTTRAASFGHGQAIIQEPCGTGTQQLWNLTQAGALKASQPVKCINYGGQCQCVAIDNGQSCELYHCTGPRGLERFTFKPSDPSDPTVGQLVALGASAATCLTVVTNELLNAADFAAAGGGSVRQDPESPLVSVEVVTTAPNVLLLLDGVPVGAQARDPNPASRNFGATADASFKVAFKPGSNLTALCRDAQNSTFAHHSLRDPGKPAGLLLTLDAPNPSKGTGSHLLLDGQDTALLRAELIDSAGIPLHRNLSINVTFAVTSGPGRVIGSHNGDPSCHTPNLAPWHMTFYGLVRGIVQVTHDASSPPRHRSRLAQIDVDGSARTMIVSPDAAAAQYVVPTEIIVTASSPGLATATIRIPLSTDVEKHSVLASATRSLASGIRW